MTGCWLYILQCRDGSYYTGTTRHAEPEARLAEHQAGSDPKAYTFFRRPVRLVFTEHFPSITDAIAAERQVKGWSRAKKQALIGRRFELLPELARCRSDLEHPSTGSG